MADTQSDGQQRTAAALRHFLAERQVAFTETVSPGAAGDSIHFTGPAGEEFIIRPNGRLSAHHGSLTQLDMAVAAADFGQEPAPGSHSYPGTADRWVTGCVIAAFVILIGSFGLLAWAKWQLRDFDFEGSDFGAALGDPCRDEVDMPSETGIPTQRSVVLGWEGECPLVLWLQYVKTTWYYATDETEEQVLAATTTSIRAHLEKSGLQSITVEQGRTFIRGSGVETAENSQVSVEVFVYSTRPGIHRLTGNQEPPGFTTYYTVELVVTARITATATPEATPAGNSTQTPAPR